LLNNQYLCFVLLHDLFRVILPHNQLT
jgi:hypothetical protein